MFFGGQPDLSRHVFSGEVVRINLVLADLVAYSEPVQQARGVGLVHELAPERIVNG